MFLACVFLRFLRKFPFDAYLAVCAGDVADDFAHRRNADAAGERVFDADDRRGDSRVHLGALEAEVGVEQFAVDQPQVFAVAERLRADDAAVFQRQVLAVPRQILAFDEAVSDGDVLRVPESVLCVERAAVENGVLNVLERIFPRHTHIPKGQRRCAQHKIFALGAASGHLDAARRPAEFGGKDVAAAQPDVFAFAQRLDAMQAGAADVYVVAVPERRAAERGHLAILNGQISVVPEGIAQIEKAARDRQVRALLEGAFAVGRPVEAAVGHGQAAGAVQRAFFVKVRFRIVSIADLRILPSFRLRRCAGTAPAPCARVLW